MPQIFWTGRHSDASTGNSNAKTRNSRKEAARATTLEKPAVEYLEDRLLLSTTTTPISKPATLAPISKTAALTAAAIISSETSPVVSVTNTTNEGLNQLIAPTVTPAATVTVTGSNGGDSSAPTPVITELTGTTAAPHTVFVHALDSVLGSGTPLTARYVWNFGDPGSQYNTLVGWNAAHYYQNPGVYTITLTLTNQLGKTRILSTDITEAPNHYRAIYVDSVAGNDSDTGATPQSAVKSVARAMQLVGSNTQLLFHAGETFDVYEGMTFNYQNVLVTSYGSGTAPVLMREAGDGTSIICMWYNSVNIVVNGLTFDSPYVPVGQVAGKIPAEGLLPAGVNNTIMNCEFLNLSDAIDESRNPQGVLIQNCMAPLATGLRSEFLWGQGTDQVIIGNYDANSTREQDIRTVGTVRELIDYNNITNLNRTAEGDPNDGPKGAIDVQRGMYAYVANNWTYVGELRVGPLNGPNFVSTDVDVWAVFEGNHTDQGSVMQIYPGTTHVMVRNNIFNVPGIGLAVSVVSSSVGGNIQDITFSNNTGVTSANGGVFFDITGGGNAGAISLTDNLWLAPNVVPGLHETGGVFLQSNSSSVLAISAGNVWTMPHTFDTWLSHGGINYIDGSWGIVSGYYTPAAWNNLPFVRTDYFAQTAVDSNYTPLVGTVAATAGVQTYGMFVDIYGNPRPATGPISAGAVQTPGVI